jgi:hypothetical protein
MLICVRRFYSPWCAAQWGVPKGRKSEPVLFPQRDPAPVEKENGIELTAGSCRSYFHDIDVHDNMRLFPKQTINPQQINDRFCGIGRSALFAEFLFVYRITMVSRELAIPNSRGNIQLQQLMTDDSDL